MDKFKETFREEAQELLTELEAALLELEKDPGDADIIGRVFRAMHTLKGSSGMFGFDNINQLTHDIENVYDLIRGGKLPVTKLLIDTTLRACDAVKTMIQPGDGDEADSAEALKLREAFRKYLADSHEPNLSGAPPVQGPATAPGENTDGQEKTYRISFRPTPDIFTSGTNPVLLLKELQGMGLCHIAAHRDEIPLLDEIDPEACYTEWEIFLTTEQDVNAIRDVFIFVEDRCVLNIEEVRDAGDPEKDKKLGEILIERGEISRDDLKKVLDSQKKIGEILVDAGLVGRERVAAALVEQQHAREVRQRQQLSETMASIRVPAARLDSLVNLVGELVTIQSRLSQLSAKGNDPVLIQVAEEVERLTAELRDNTMSIRMLPIGTTFSKFQRLVRDLSSELGKDIVLITEGAETELDKTVIERLNDPLVHLIRNCIDHGIERPELREAAGKPCQGTVRLSAEHSGASVLIRISDDGAGLDAERIRAKAVEKGLIAPDATLDDKEVFALILAPGFSTAEKITSVSGRGVGMDVVKRNIDALQGSITITTERGAGTTITLKLPLTLAIIDGLLVKIGEASFILPLSFVDECVELTAQQIAAAHERHLANIRGEIVPYIRLRERFEINGARPAIEQIVTTKVDGQRVGLVVDQVVGEHQTVIKPLGRIYRGLEEASGATILGDGQVALIIDIPRLIRQVEEEA